MKALMRERKTSLRTAPPATVALLPAALTFLILGTGCGASPTELAKGAPLPAAPAPLTAAPPIADEPEAPETLAKIEPALKPATEKDYGKYDGEPVKLYTITNSKGLVLKATNYGAIITELHVPDKKGNMADIVQGFDSLDDYVKSSPYFGATIGRLVNRIKNAKFTLEGKNYTLFANDPPNHLHGGKKGWDKVIWNADTKIADAGPQIIFTHTSPDGDENYPGNVEAKVVYTLTNENELKVEMTATTDKTTLINMAHHTYWNLGGHASGTIQDHELTLMADSYTPASGLVPTGEVKAVKGTPFDFTTAKLISRDLQAAGGKPVGFDHNWIVNGDPHALRPVARLKHPGSGRVMQLSADQPGVQFYSGNFLDGTLKGKGGATYPQYSGLCLETQKFPNSINVPAWRDEVIVKPGETYSHTMVHKFTVE